MSLPRGFPLDAATAAWLAEHGLPRDASLLLRFRDGPLAVREGAAGELLVVGQDGGTELAVDGSGRLLSIDAATGATVRYVAASLVAFLACLRLYELRLPALRVATDEDGARIAAELRAEMAALDAAAVEDEDAWWALVLEQTEQGLL